MYRATPKGDSLMLRTIRKMLGKYSLRPYKLGMRESEHKVLHTLSAFPPKIQHKTEDILQRFKLTETQKLDGIIEGSQHNLFTAKSVILFKLVADSIKIDRQKLTIVHNEFLMSSQTASTPIKDITNVQADAGPFFGNITITSKHFLNNTQTIHLLRRTDTQKIQRLIQGFMIAHRARIDTDEINDKDLLPMLLRLGEANI